MLPWLSYFNIFYMYFSVKVKTIHTLLCLPFFDLIVQWLLHVVFEPSLFLDCEIKSCMVVTCLKTITHHLSYICIRRKLNSQLILLFVWQQIKKMKNSSYYPAYTGLRSKQLWLHQDMWHLNQDFICKRSFRQAVGRAWHKWLGEMDQSRLMSTCLKLMKYFKVTFNREAEIQKLIVSQQYIHWCLTIGYIESI